MGVERPRGLLDHARFSRCEWRLGSARAERLAISLIGFQEADPLFDAVMSNGIAFLRARGISRTHTTGYENQWWVAHGDGQPWLVGRPIPDASAASIRQLDQGEVRRVAKMGPEGNKNDILVTATEGGFKSMRARAQLCADLGGLTRLLKKRIGKSSWPFDVVWMSDRNEPGYRMDAERVAWWSVATASDQDVPASQPTDIGHDRTPGDELPRYRD